MKYIIAGGTGFIGQALVNRWLAAGHQIVVIGRSHEKINSIFNKKVQAITWQDLHIKNENLFSDANAIINLAGASIGEKSWSEQRRQEILSSRTETTQQLANICANLGTQSPPLFNASAVGIYGLQKSTSEKLPPAYDENTSINFQEAPDFLAQIGRAWESAAEPAVAAGVRVVWMRFGVVLAKHGGVLPRLSLPFKLFTGGPIGSGQQPFSWISLTDLCNAIDFLLNRQDVVGPFNLVAPGCVTQKQLAHVLGKVLHRPSFVPTPAFVLKLIFGQMADELLLSGQHVFPQRLLQLGYSFQYPDIEKALTNIYTES